eukprot:g16057.t1
MERDPLEKSLSSESDATSVRQCLAAALCKSAKATLGVRQCPAGLHCADDAAFALYRLAKLQGGRDLGIDMPLATSMLARAVIDMSNDEFNPKCLATA